MSSEINFVQQIIQALEEIKDSSLSSLVARHELIKKLLDQLERHSLWLRANDGSYCTNCITDDHLNFQCKYSDNPTLANYNRDKSYASLEVVEYVLFIGASEMVFRLGSIDVKCEALDRAFNTVLLVYLFCENNLSNNALVVNLKRSTTAMEKDNLLQDSLKSGEEKEHKEEEEERIDHPLTPSTPTFDSIIATNTLVGEKEEQKGEVDKESHTTNFVCDASHSSSDFYDAKTVDNCSEEALCLDTHMESINNNELEIEPCYTNMQGPELPAMKEEYFELFP